MSSAIPITGISGRGTSGENETFGFFLPPREGEILKNRLLQGEEIIVHARVESQILDYELEVSFLFNTWQRSLCRRNNTISSSF